MYSRSTDQGATFSTPQLLSFGIEFSEQPTIAFTQTNEIAVFWNGTRARSFPKFEIFNARSADGGATFNSMNTVASGASSNLYAPSVANDGAGNTYVSYESCDGSCRIEVMRSTGNLSSFGSPVIVSKGVLFAFKSSVAALSDGTVHVAMVGALADGDPKFEIFTASSSDKGANFTPAKNISNTPESSNDPTIAAAGRKVYVAWLDTTPGNKEIFFSVSEDAGANFSSAANLSSNITISQVPTLAADSTGTIHIGFEDETDGNDETYYSRLAGPPKLASVLSIDPDKGAPGASVVVRGPDLSSVSSVDFNGVQAEFFVDSTSSLIAIVPAGARTGSINVQTSAGAAPSPAPFTVTSAISINASLIDFGFVVPGQTIEPKQVLIKNLGSAPLKISALSISGPEFQLASPPQLPLDLAPDNILRIDLNFRPTVEGERSGSLKISSNDAALPSVSLALTGRAGTPALTLFAPNGGEKLRGGDSFFIQWNAGNQNFAGFDLLLSTDGGKTFGSTIAAGLSAQARNFTWTVPSVKTKTARVAIVGRSSNGLVFMDQSDANFKIKAKRQ